MLQGFEPGVFPLLSLLMKLLKLSDEDLYYYVS